MRDWRFKLCIVVAIVLSMIAAITVTASAMEPVVGISDVYAQMTANTTLQSEKTDLRFIMAVDSLEYKEVGFIISQHPLTGVDFDKLEFIQSPTNENMEVAQDNGYTYLRIRITTVYESISASGNTIPASQLGGAYLATCTVANIANKNFADTLHVVGYSLKRDKDTLEIDATYTAEKLTCIAERLGGTVTPSSYKNYVLVSTWNNNSRTGDNRITPAKGSISVVELGKDITVANVEQLTYKGARVDSLVGSPVKIGFDASNNPISVEKLGTSVLYHESDIDVTYNSSTGKYSFALKNGTALNLDTNKLVDNYKKYSFAPNALIFFGTKSLSGISNTDEYITFYDTDENGTYDFYSRKAIVNAAEVVAIDGKTITLKGQYGSADSSGWFEGKVAHNYEKANGVGEIKVGDRVNFLLTIDCDSDTYNHATFPARLTILSKSDTFVGAPTKVTYGPYQEATTSGYSVVSNHSSEDVQKYIDVTVGGKTYSWSDCYVRNSNYADGSFGVRAGRTLMQKANYGTNMRFYTDTTGNIVYCETLAPAGNKGDYKLVYGSGNTVELSTQWDIQGRFVYGNVTYTNIYDQVKALYDSGYRRLSLVYTNPGYPAFAANRIGANGRSNAGVIDETFKAMGYDRPIFAVVDVCHKLGMECYAIYKPYEGGGDATIPTNGIVNEDYSHYPFNGQPGIGGLRGTFDTFLDEGFANGKDYRISRRADGANNNNNLPVTAIVVYYLNSSYHYIGGDNAISYETVRTVTVSSSSITRGTGYRPGTNPHPSHPVYLWTSKDNFTYTPTTNYSYKYETVSEVRKDANGQYLLNSSGNPDTNARSYTRLTVIPDTPITAEDAKYFALSFKNKENLMSCLYSMVELYNGSTKISCSISDYVRRPNEAKLPASGDPADYEWGDEYVPVNTTKLSSASINSNGGFTVSSSADAETKAAANFNKYGFEFNWYPFPSGATSTRLFAISRGVAETTPGTPCEAYEETRAYWLDTVKEIVDGKYGFDGVEVRLHAHASMIPDYYNYGYNEPIVEAYKTKYGEAAYNTLMDPTHTVTHQEYKRIMEIRGEFFMQFAADAYDYCVSQNKQFAINLRTSYEDLSDIGEYADSDRRYMVDAMNLPTHWTAPKILINWKDAIDHSTYVSFKDYIVETTGSAGYNLAGHAKEMKAYAKSQNKDVWIIAYDEQGRKFEPYFLNYVANNLSDVDGVYIYETRNTYFWAKQTHEVFESINARLESTVFDDVVILTSTPEWSVRQISDKNAIVSAGQVAYVPWGKAISGNDSIHSYADFNSSAELTDNTLLCAPVRFTYSGGKVSKITAAGTSVSFAQWQVTKNSDGTLAFGDQTLVLDAGTLGSSNPASFAIFMTQTFRIHSWDIWNTAHGLVSDADDLVTLYDVDGDGDYDFARCIPWYHAGEVCEVTDDGFVAINGAYGGSAAHYSWHVSTNKVLYKLADPSIQLKVGDRVRFICQYSANCQSPVFGSYPAYWYIYKVETVNTGKLESVTVGTKSGAKNYYDIKMTVDGVEYTWSEQMVVDTANPTWNDGVDGASAGRNILEDNIGATINFWCNDDGEVVSCKVVQ